MSHKVYREMKIDITLRSRNTRQVHVPLHVQNFSSGLNNIANSSKGQWIPQSFMNLQRKCGRSCQQLQIVNLQASSSTQTALLVLTTAGRSMHYLALSQILLRRICVATAWEQLLGSFCSCCFHNTAALDNSMSANCRTSCPRYKRPTSYLCGIAQFVSTRIASSQVKSSVLSHPEFESRMLRICSGYDTEPSIAHTLKGILNSWWGKAEDTDLHKLAEELRVKAVNRTTNADPPSVRAKQSIVRWSRCRSATLHVLVLVFHSCNRPTTAPSKPEATPNLVSTSSSSSSSQNYRTQQQEKQQQQQLLLLYALLYAD
jgi:hypothetical protein